MSNSPLHIEKLVYGGDGLGYHHGKAVFIPLTVPGDTVLWKRVQDKKRFSRGLITRITEPSPLRIAPSCPDFGTCGGCHWQHIGYSGQTGWKQKIFSSTMARNCGIPEDKIKPLIPSPDEWYYRIRTRLRVRWTRNGVETGFFQGRSHRLVPVENCPVLDRRLNLVIEKIRAHLINRPGAPARGTRLIILEAGDSGGVRIILDAGQNRRNPGHELRHRTDELEAFTTILASSCTFPVTVMARENDGIVTAGRGRDIPPVIQPLGPGGIQLKMPPGEFSQINPAQNRTLVSLVMDAVRQSLPAPSRILDLYCGMGNFTLPLAGLCHEIHGVDASAVSIEAAKRNAGSNSIRNAEFTAMPVESFVASARKMKDWSLVLLDPPRTGAASAVKAIAHIAPRTVIYVSCDPMTLVRDMKVLLEAGYTARWSRPVDLFPHTYHIESVTVLDRSGLT